LPDKLNEALRDLAIHFGLEPEYVDNWGRTRRAGFDAIRQILEAKGLRVSPELGGLQPEVVVARVDRPPERFSFSFDASGVELSDESPAALLKIVLEDEAGEKREFIFDPPGFSFCRDDFTRAARIEAPFPSGLDEGVYTVRADLSVGRDVLSAFGRWLICPTRAYVSDRLEQGGRIAGVGVALYGLRSNRNWGVGDFTDLKAIVGWAAQALRVDFVGLNPLHALFNRSPYNISPYLPSSRLFRNFIYLDVESIPDFDASPAAKTLVDSAETRGGIQRLRDADRVDYDAAADLKLAVLREVFRSFVERCPKGAQPRADFDAYCAAKGTALERFAVFCALDERFRGQDPPIYKWREWSADLTDPSSETVKRFTAENREAVEFWMYLQWQVENQLAEVQQDARNKGMLVGLYHDLALGVDPHGADAWAMQDYFHDSFRVGAPPDAFAPNGQEWGFSPPRRESVRASGYDPFRNNLQANCQFGGALRIDHVLQLHRLFCMPVGAEPSVGFYVKDFEADLINVLAMESRRSQTLIIGEDLGTVPFDLRERLMEKGVLSYRLFYFERDWAGNQLPWHAYPQNAMVSITTHDLPTLAGFWSGKDIDLRLEIGQINREKELLFRKEREEHKKKIVERLAQDGFITAGEAESAAASPSATQAVQSAVLAFLFQTPSKLVQINQEDIFLDDRQQNLPGTTWERPNWVTKMSYTVEELWSHPEALRMTGKARWLLEHYGRARR
jgi:4-alpha-glucanotransferase